MLFPYSFLKNGLYCVIKKLLKVLLSSILNSIKNINNVLIKDYDLNFIPFFIQSANSKVDKFYLRKFYKDCIDILSA
jgi:hypothetical protein